jgi:hypothetical protein
VRLSALPLVLVLLLLRRHAASVLAHLQRKQGIAAQAAVPTVSLLTYSPGPLFAPLALPPAVATAQQIGAERMGTSQPGYQAQPELVHGEDGEDR